MPYLQRKQNYHHLKETEILLRGNNQFQINQNRMVATKLLSKASSQLIFSRKRLLPILTDPEKIYIGYNTDGKYTTEIISLLSKNFKAMLIKIMNYLFKLKGTFYQWFSQHSFLTHGFSTKLFKQWFFQEEVHNNAYQTGQH